MVGIDEIKDRYVYAFIIHIYIIFIGYDYRLENLICKNNVIIKVRNKVVKEVVIDLVVYLDIDLVYNYDYDINMVKNKDHFYKSIHDILMIVDLENDVDNYFLA